MTSTDADHKLSWLMSDLVQRVPRTRSALLLSRDGLVKARTPDLGPDDADHLSAVASALWSLADGAARRFARDTAARQVVVVLDGTMLFVAAAGFGTCLCVLADDSADPGQIGYEMAQLVRAVEPHLETAPRRSVTGGLEPAGS